MQTKIVRSTYFLSVLILTLSGFGQMPVFKRYYIADIPGLGWLAQFYITHYLHYLSAAVFLGLSAFVVVDYFLSAKKQGLKITTSGYIKVLILSGLILTGVLLVLKNFEGYFLSPGIIALLDVTHLGLVMILLVVSLLTLVLKKKWTKQNIEE
jgi:uncharacterized membrane protein